MKSNLSIQLKAAFLIIVFSLNTIIGFACAIGIDMGFNSHHDDADNDHHKSKDGKDNCCNDKVIKFNEVDKSSSHSLSTSITPVFFTAYIASFYNISDLYNSYIDANIKYFVRSYHPPIPDIRIEIQSFQI